MGLQNGVQQPICMQKICTTHALQGCPLGDAPVFFPRGRSKPGLRAQWGGEEEEELPAISTVPVPADIRERVPTPRVSTTRIKMQDHRLE